MTVASLFDGHDAAINIMRRLLQAQGVEVVHLGHNRSVDEVVPAAVQEDVQGVAVELYQGGHVEYFAVLVDRLRAAGRADVQVYGGAGGTIVAARSSDLQRYGVARIFSPQDGQAMGLAAMVNSMVAACDHPLAPPQPGDLEAPSGAGDHRALARVITRSREQARSSRGTRPCRTSRRPAPGARAGHHRHGRSGSPRSRTSWSAASRIDQEDKLRDGACWPSTRPAAREAGPCSATASA